jgi:hypothetical protein
MVDKLVLVFVPIIVCLIDIANTSISSLERKSIEYYDLIPVYLRLELLASSTISLLDDRLM